MSAVDKPKYSLMVFNRPANPLMSSPRLCCFLPFSDYSTAQSNPEWTKKTPNLPLFFYFYLENGYFFGQNMLNHQLMIIKLVKKVSAIY
jgi:hypothetical protein